ncbi:MAG: carbohydrate-binding domain-containing protein [Bacteroidales bacterium]|nr:carbohydrate-binding domain-containing protein [Bacteroidales bacterium]
MKKIAFLLTILISCLGLQAQDYYINLHTAGQVMFQSNVNGINSMNFQGSNPTSLNINLSNDNYSFPISAFDSITFDLQNPAQLGDTVMVNYNGSTATVQNPFPSSVFVTTSGAKVTISSIGTSNIVYCLSGTAEPGRFEIESTTTPTILLNGVSLTNPTGKAMDLTCEDGIILKLADGTENQLCDGAESDKKAALMCNNDLLVQGNGTLTVTGLVQHAAKVKGQLNMTSGTIVVASSVTDGIHAEGLLVQGGNINVLSCGDDALTSELDAYIYGGNITITSSSDSINAISIDSTLIVNGGTIDINITGNDAKCIKADKELTINGGTFILNHSGDVSKGIKSNQAITITDGDFTIVSSGSTVLETISGQNVPSYCTAIKGDTDINISGGTFNITLPTTNHGGKSISADGNLTISGGTFDILTQGDGAAYTVSGNTKDAYTSSCIKSDGNMVISGGNFTLRSTGSGGKGISADGTLELGIPNGNNEDLILDVTTTGNRITVSSGGGWPGGGGGEYANPKAIKAQGLLTINSGTTTVLTTGTGGEGLESKTQINIEGGQHYFKCYDDCINSSGKIIFNDGVTVCFSNGNDAVDSNAGQAGAITIGNGVIFAYSTKGSPEEGFDCDNNNYIRITGTGIGISAGGSQGGGWPGGGGGGGTITNPAQGYKFYTSSYNFQTGKYYTLSSASGSGGTNMVTFSFEANCNSSLALITATGMVSGSTYYVKYGNEAPTNPTTEFHGIYLGGTSSASTQAFSFIAQ